MFMVSLVSARSHDHTHMKPLIWVKAYEEWKDKFREKKNYQLPILKS
jgi:hypothetical protein